MVFSMKRRQGFMEAYIFLYFFPLIIKTLVVKEEFL